MFRDGPLTPGRGHSISGGKSLAADRSPMMHGDGSPASGRDSLAHGHGVSISPVASGDLPVFRYDPPVTGSGIPTSGDGFSDPGSGHSASRANSQGTGSALQVQSPSTLLVGDQLSSEIDLAVIGTDWDIREHIRALPNKEYIQQLIAAVEQSCKQAVEGLREDTVALLHVVEVMENCQEYIV